MRHVLWRHHPGSITQVGRFCRRGSGRLLNYAMPVLLAASLVTAIAAPEPAVAAPPAKPACPAGRPDRVSASAAARLCGAKVEVTGEKSETLQLWANPDGTLTADQSAGPVRMRDAKNGWMTVDPALQADADGGVSAKAHPRGLKLAGQSGDGEHEVVRLGSGDDAVGLLWQGRLPKPRIEGTKATYADVADGVDLVIESTRGGYEQYYVVKTREALSRSGKLTLKFRSPGLTATPDGHGGLLFKDKKGREAGRIPQPAMWDAARGEHSLDPLHVGAVGLAASQRGRDITLELTPDPALLAMKDLTFPITIDPSVTLTFDTFVQNNFTTDQSGSSELKLGYSDDGGSFTARSFINWDTAFLSGAQVNSATVNLWETHSWSCTAATWEIWTTSAAGTGTRWNAQPTWYAPQGSSTQTKGYSSACNDGWVSANATALFQTGAGSGWATTTMGLKAQSETNHNGWKRFSSAQGSNPPYATITFNATPQVTSQSTDPSTECVSGANRPYVRTVQPKLRAQVTDPEGSPVSATFEWWTTGGAMIGSTTVGPQASGTSFEATVPAAAFTNGGTYSWRVRGTDGGTTGAYGSWCEFTVDTGEPGSAPGVSSPTFPAGAWTGQLTGYTASTAATPYVNGTTTVPLSGDDAVGQITLPFPITYYGQTYSTAWVDTNGMLSFVNPNGSHPDDIVPLPNSAAPNAAVYVFAQDLIVDASASIRTATLGTAPNRQFLVEWNNPYQFGNTSRRQNAEVLFSETSGTVTLNYSGIDNAFEQGSAALVGVENGDGTTATQYSFHTPSLNNDTAVVFTYNAGTAPVSAGTAANFTFTPAGVTDVASYQYGVDTNPPTTVVNAPSLGANATVSITPDSDGPHTLYVRSQDRAGNQSPITAYQFNVGHGGLTSPKAGDITAGKVALTTTASPAATGVSYQWRRADTDTWQTIPLADVSLAAGGGAITWPLTKTSGQFPKLNWNLDTTVNAAEAGPDPLDGPLQVRALFTGGASAPVKISFDRNQASAATSAVGPGTVNLLTGNYTLSDTDVSVDSYGSDLTVTRAFNTRRPAAVDKAGMFGPGWVSGVVVEEAEAPYTNLTVTGSLVQVGLPGGDTLGFTQKTSTASAKTYDSETGLEQLALSYATSGDAYTLRDYDGNVVLFTRVAGASAGVYSPTAVSTPGSGQTTTIGWEKVMIAGSEVIRPTRALAPVPTGVACATLVKGCRALDFTYATATTATGTGQAQWGDYLGRVSQISFTAWDPDASPAAMRTVVVARYSYDSNGRLRATWDPRLDWTDPSVHHLADTYDYDADGIVTTVTPKGGEEPWQLSYTTVPGDPGKGRLAQVSRSALTAGTARHTVVYKVPVSGTGSAYDLSATQTARWGQAEQPVDATAVFTPAQVPTGDQAAGTLPGSYERATVTYLDPNGRAVDVVTPGGHTSATWYDAFGNTVRTLTAGNRARALDASASDTAAAEAALAARLSTVNVYSTDGQELRETFGPEHELVLNSGAVVRGRKHTVNVYDQGAPNTGGPYRLVTTSTTTARYTGAAGTDVDADARTTTTAYDWALRLATVSTLDAGGLALATRTTYDAGTGLTTSVTAPAGGATTNTPATRTTVYYRAGTASGQSECDNHPEWANLVCRYQPGGQAASGPELPVTVTTYDLYNQPRTVVEKTSGGVLRTTTTTYDGAGRAFTVAVTGASGTGQAVPTRRNVYDAATGRHTRTQSLDGSGIVTAENIRGYDTLGRTTAYTDADGNASSTTYDLLGRVATTNDGKATRTNSYDGGSERRGLATGVADAQAGTFGGSYDADGRLTGQTWPNGVVVATGYDETGAERSITYTKPGCGQSDCTLFTETVRSSAHGQQRDGGSSLSSQRYSYDNAGRLSTVSDTVNNACTTRAYAYNTATDRTSLATYNPGTGGACQTTTAASTSTWSYDTSGRFTSAGYVYDSLGRATTVPAVDTGNAGGGNLTAGYHVTDLVSTITHAGRTTTYTLDATGERIRGWSDNDGTTTTTKTNHYTADTDRPAWTDEAGGAWNRVVAGVGGMAALTTTFGVTDTDWQLTDLRGNIVATVHNTDAGLTTAGGSTEFGTQRNASDTGNRRYGWLGAEQRAADTPAGVVLMGVRLYLPTIGRFLSVDPVFGGSCGRYDYTCADPQNNSDLDGRENRPSRYNRWNPWAGTKALLQRAGNRIATAVGQWWGGARYVWNAGMRGLGRLQMWGVGRIGWAIQKTGPWTWRDLHIRAMIGFRCAGMHSTTGPYSNWTAVGRFAQGFFMHDC
ncbi:RHS repeat-associated core domain-containing protein [Dactylosporangium sp. NPDC000244]|uniref:RHS repeat-associated core domain-containing protein n=1 Tax=Dactylosporangium sp. NPDC000244 TaxID=3154365 RepID=UPI00331DD4C8